MVTFATPYAIFVFQEYGRSIPIELDESARIDGAVPGQVYLRIYLPLMAPSAPMRSSSPGTRTSTSSSCCPQSGA
jgi:ABC-type glycerol-3-phosphate transport system permease component